MADKVKLTPPMTDSKTPEWAREQAEDVHIMLVATKEANIETISQALTYAEQSGYERGRKEGIEEAAKVVERETEAPAQRNSKFMWVQDIGDRLASAIRQLLEVKKDIDTRQNTK